MKVERTEPVGQSTTWLHIHLDDGSHFKVPAYAVADAGAFPGKELTEEALSQLRAEAAKMQTRECAIRAVAASSISEKSLQKRLVQKGATEESAEETVEWLRELRLIDDAQTAAQLVRSAAAKGYGISRVKSILYEKGIPKELWEDALSTLPEMDDAIDRFLHQKLDGKVLDEKIIKKTADALLRRGHSWQDVREGLCRYQEGLDLEDME